MANDCVEVVAILLLEHYYTIVLQMCMVVLKMFNCIHQKFLNLILCLTVLTCIIKIPKPTLSLS